MLTSFHTLLIINCSDSASSCLGLTMQNRGRESPGEMSLSGRCPYCSIQHRQRSIALIPYRTGLKFCLHLQEKVIRQTRWSVQIQRISLVSAIRLQALDDKRHFKHKIDFLCIQRFLNSAILSSSITDNYFQWMPFQSLEPNLRHLGWS